MWTWRDKVLGILLGALVLPIVLPIEGGYRAFSWAMEKLVGDN